MSCILVGSYSGLFVLQWTGCSRRPYALTFTQDMLYRSVRSVDNHLLQEAQMNVWTITCLLTREDDEHKTENVCMNVEQDAIPEGVERMLRMYAPLVVLIRIHRAHKTIPMNLIEKKD